MMGAPANFMEALQNQQLQFGGPMNFGQQFGSDGIGGMMGMQQQQGMDTSGMGIGGMNPFMEVKMETEDSPPEMKPDIDKISELSCYLFYVSKTRLFI